MSESERSSIAKSISEQLHRMLETKKQQAELIQHNLEKGLGNEQALRDLLRWFLPKRFGVAKGKVANYAGVMSRQTDIIIYDALHCPTLFIDENENQILPVEGVYEVVEVKTTLTASALEDAFENLKTVYQLQTRTDRSTNDFVTCCPPSLNVFAFSDKRSLSAIADQFDRLSVKFPVKRSFSSYSKKSPGYADHTGRQYLVSNVYILGKGCILHMLDGFVEIYDWGEYTLGMFLTGIVNEYERMKLQTPPLTEYLNWILVDEWRGTNKIEERDRKRKPK
jgi:hypothetical protein